MTQRLAGTDHDISFIKPVPVNCFPSKVRIKCIINALLSPTQFLQKN